ncbi:MAG: lectin like domain-containing protein [Coriobacteriales bacterium]|nr:lectin like domain-containing protein [Coriobacteriales bacterium]
MQVYPKKVVAWALAVTMGLSGVYVPNVAWAEEEPEIPEWAIDDGQSENPEEESPVLQTQAALPAAYDMRDDGIVTPVKSQGHMMSCWTFGGVAAAETSILSANTTAFGSTYEDSHIDLSERHLAFFSLNPVSEADDPAQAGEGMHTFATNTNAAFDAGGATLFVTSLYATGVGPVVEQAFPYRGVDANGESHTNLQLYEADPYGETVKWVKEKLKDELKLNRDISDAELEALLGESLDSIVEKNKQKAYEGIMFNVYYTPEEDWSIPLVNENGASNRCLQCGVLLKDGNVLPEYWAADDPEHTAPRDEAITAMKQEILNGHGVCLAYSSSSGPVQYKSQVERPDHGVCVVGWNDNFHVGNDVKDGAWICKNSWGSETDACEDDLGNVVNSVAYGYQNEDGQHTGYFYLSYYDKTIYKLETMDFTDTLGSLEGALAVAQHDYMPACNGFYVADNSDKVTSSANVFDADRNFEIRGVSTFTAEPNTRVTFAIYELNDGATTPTDGRLLYRTSQNFGYEGFHRLDLTQRPTVAQGRKFSIVSTASTLDNDGKRVYRVAANRGISEEEGRAGGRPFYATAVVNEGESFISNGSSWQDWKQYKADNNVEEYGPVDNFSIKAYGAIIENPVASVSYAGHVQGTGDVPAARDGETLGTVGASKRLEQFSAQLFGVDGASICYRAHVQGIGWTDEARDGVRCGTTGESRRIEAVQMRLEGVEGQHVWYRVHSQRYGWLGWACDGQPAGTAGQSRRVEAIEVKVLPDGADLAAELKDYVEGQASYVGAATGGAHVQGTGWTKTASALSFGTTGKSKRVEAIKLSLANQPLGSRHHLRGARPGHRLDARGGRRQGRRNHGQVQAPGGREGEPRARERARGQVLRVVPGPLPDLRLAGLGARRRGRRHHRALQARRGDRGAGAAAGPGPRGLRRRPGRLRERLAARPSMDKGDSSPRSCV